MIAQDKLNDFFSELKKATGGDIRTDRYHRLLYSTDASIYQVMPLGVVLPRVIEEVHATVELASKFGIPLLARTSGSSLAGQAVNEAVVIDMTRHLDKILEINEEERWVRVMPGIVLDELNLSLKKHGLKFGPDPASSNRAAMGGIVSNNSTGAHSILYGMTADHVLECKGFFSDGSPFHFYPLSPEELFYKQKLNTFEGEVYRQLYELVSQHSETIRKHTPRYWRRCGGYNLDRLLQDGVSYKYPQEPQFNLAKLISGAEGTLAIMSEIKLNLVTPPKKTALALVQFNTLHEALTSVPVMLEVNPSAIELIDNLGLTLCKEVPEYARLLATFMTGNPNCILVTEFYGETETELKHHIEKLKTVLKNNNIHCEVVTALDPQMQQNVWTVRKVGLGLLMSIKGDYKPIPFIEDAAVPPEHLAEYIARIEKFCNELGTRVAYYAHASAGCLHVRPLINTKVASDIKKLPEIATFSAELVAQYGGALSSEHGDGRCRSWLNEKFYGPELFALYKQVKRIFDPHNILNPGNIVDFHSMTENLRYGENYQSLPINTHLDFSSEQGFDRAIEMCNGAAVCRKRTEGTMCPSFMVTREEEHSTRGRANMLRAVHSGRLPAEELTGKRMFQVMDLCVECKGCKAECPSSVDMAKIKFEFLAQYYHKHPIPLRTRLFANIPALSRMASGLQAPIINFIMNATPTRFLMQLFLGISRFRTFPEFARESFSSWYGKNRTSSQPQAGKKQVVLLADTFNNYQHPPTLKAALELLEHLGYEVILPSHGCCGRPSISKGLVNKARKFASGTVSALKPFIEAGIPIIGLEPSCLLTFRDEYVYLLPEEELVQKLASQSYLLEEFLLKELNNGSLQFEHHHGGRILFHGHCHQKALVGAEVSRKVLEAAGYEVEVIDSGCCGMAGSFGYEKEHYHYSISMAERKLIPAIWNAAPDTTIVAPGISCRQQILHNTGKDAIHPALALVQALRITQPQEAVVTQNHS